MTHAPCALCPLRACMHFCRDNSFACACPWDCTVLLLGFERRLVVQSVRVARRALTPDRHPTLHCDRPPRSGVGDPCASAAPLVRVVSPPSHPGPCIVLSAIAVSLGCLCETGVRPGANRGLTGTCGHGAGGG